MPDRLAKVFPFYLSDPSKEQLRKRIEAYPTDKSFFAYSWEGPPEPLQGDAWNGFTKFDFDTGEPRKVAGIVLSNSCDIDVGNVSMRERNVAFVPVVTLDRYAQRLRDSGVSENKISSHVDAIRSQQTTQILYVPESKRTPELVVAFDDIASQPLASFLDHSEKERLFRLNNYGFYVLLMKFAINFMRFGEALDRGD